jgi:hypothetical protein
LDIFKKRFSRKGVWTVFAVSAFPLHVWTFILFFRDYSWIAERTNPWDAIGVGSYGLLVAFSESILVFLIGSALRFALPTRWDEGQWVPLIGVMIFFCELWAILGQVYFLMGLSIPVFLQNFLTSQTHPLWYLYGGSLMVVGLPLVITVYFVLKSPKFRGGVYLFFDRIALLTSLYLFLDFLGFINVLLRNVF